MKNAKMLAILVLVFGLAGSASADLVAHYEFEGNVNDSSGNGLHGILESTATIILDAERGNALSLNGRGDYVDCGNDPRFDITDEITVAAWIKVNMFDKNWQAIITKGDSTWRLQRLEDADSIAFHCAGLSLDGRADGNVNVNDGQWHHVAGVYDSSKIFLYVDGVPDNSADAAGTINRDTFSVLIGENAEVTGCCWNGLIDDVRIYNNAISEAEIAELAGTSSETEADYLAPIAYALISSDGTVLSGTPNVSCTFNPNEWQYEITIAGENYVWSEYVTVVTVSASGAGIIPVNASSDGKLVVWIYTLDGWMAMADFQFVTYKPPPLDEQNIIELTDANFDEIVLSSDVPVLVDFWAAWCGSCLTMAPVIREIADEYAGKAKICKLNIDDSPGTTMNYGISSIPTFILFKDGEVQQQWVGVTSKEELTAAIDELL